MSWRTVILRKTWNQNEYFLRHVQTVTYNSATIIITHKILFLVAQRAKQINLNINDAMRTNVSMEICNILHYKLWTTQQSRWMHTVACAALIARFLLDNNRAYSFIKLSIHAIPLHVFNNTPRKWFFCKIYDVIGSRTIRDKIYLTYKTIPIHFFY